jgi:hypothetical protein
MNPASNENRSDLSAPAIRTKPFMKKKKKKSIMKKKK